MSKCGDELDDVFMIRSALGEKTDGIAKRAKEIKKRGDCLYLSELKIDGRDLTSIGIRGKEVGNTLSLLLEQVHGDPTLNERTTLTEIVKKEKNL